MSRYILGLDIGSVSVKAAVAKVEDSGAFSICGLGKAKTTGIKKGVISNIEKASLSIKEAVKEAKKSAGLSPNIIIASVSGAYTKSVESQGIVSVPDGEITINEIKRAMQMAKDNAKLPKEHDILHLLPYEFKVDEQNHIEDPIGMSGSRLEVCTHAITADKNSISNLLKATQMAGLKIDNLVLSGYASAISTLSKDEKELGVALIDMGGATSEIVVHLGNSIRFNDSLPVGSSNITMDLTHALTTPLEYAEQLKLDYATLIAKDEKELSLPTTGERTLTHKVSLEMAADVILARVEETLLLLSNILEKSGYQKRLGGGIVLTGGMAKLDDIRNLATIIFNNAPIRVAKPRHVDGLFEISNDSENSAVLGLCLYGAGEFTNYEIDFNGELKYGDSFSYKDEIIEEEIESNLDINDNGGGMKLSIPQDKESIGFLKKFYNRITQLF